MLIGALLVALAIALLVGVHQISTETIVPVASHEGDVVSTTPIRNC